jgi:YD repeat-containing protein
MTYDDDGQLSTKTFSATPSQSRNYTYSPDGQETSIQSTQWGTETEAYDADGNRTSVVEPANQLDPGTITYTYYPDDLRQSLSVAIATSTGIMHLPQVMQYDYQTDGMLKTQQVNGGSAFDGGAYNWTYDTSDRERTQTDPSTKQSFTATLLAPASGPQTTYPVKYGAKTTGYDAYGRVNALTLPTGASLSGYTIDDEDEVLQ